MKIDHLIVGVDKKYQKDKMIIDSIKKSGFPFQPSWGKGTKGFKVSNIWIGREYFEMFRLLNVKGGGWKQEWLDKYNKGIRGLICIMLESGDLDLLYGKLSSDNITVTKPEFLRFKWFFNLFTRTMPWRNCYVDFFEGLPLQIGFQQMKNEDARKFMEAYMVPNSTDNLINGIKKITVKGGFSDNDFKKIQNIFSCSSKNENYITVELENNQEITFEKNIEFEVLVIADCCNPEYKNKFFKIENVEVKNE